MRKLVCPLVLVGAATVGGCVLPVPHVKRTCGPIKGVVIDAATRGPVAAAEVRVRYPDGGQRQTRSDPEGYFRFPAKCRFHWGFLIGIALNYSLPYDCGWHDFTLITIEAPGYRPVCFAPSGEHVQPEQMRESDEGLRRYRPIHPRAWPVGEHPRTWQYPSILLAAEAVGPHASGFSAVRPGRRLAGRRVCGRSP